MYYTIADLFVMIDDARKTFGVFVNNIPRYIQLELFLTQIFYGYNMILYFKIINFCL